MRAAVLAHLAVAAAVGVIALSPLVSAASAPDGTPCQISTAGGLFDDQTGVVIDGKCVSASDTRSGDDRIGPQAQYRVVGCTQQLRIVFAGPVGNATCDRAVPRCKLLVEGGQPGSDPVVAFENQVRQPGASRWTNLGFWCPQTVTAAAVPNAATVRDQVIKLLPGVAVGSTGSPATLVNLQTILWAETPARRSLGRVVIVGQWVWLRLAFDHADWSFGDGDTERSQDPGKVYDAVGDRCAQVLCPEYYGHVYRVTGSVTISLRVAWRAMYSLDGVRFTAVDPAPLTGPVSTQALLVRQARTVLVPNPDSS